MSTQGTYLQGIADAIRAKDGTAEPIPAKDFARRIRDIPAGGGGRPGEPLDPKAVYQANRPAGWLPMPAPADNEIYLLFHIQDGASALLAFTAECTGSYTVELGTVRDGAFVQKSTRSVASGGKYEAELSGADYGDLTSDGMKQVMVKVSGSDISAWEPSTHSKKTAPSSFTSWSIVEIACRLPKGKKVRCGSSTTANALKKLRFFSWAGENAVTDLSYQFGDCSGLEAVLELDTSGTTDLSYLFRNCQSLLAIPQLDTGSADTMASMFASCARLTAVPPMNTGAVTTMANMFSGCHNLEAVPEMDTARVTNMGSMFSSCYSLAKAPGLDMSGADSLSTIFSNCYAMAEGPVLDMPKATNVSNMFNNCYSLASLTFGPCAGWAGVNFTIANCSLGHGALVALLDSLPAISSGRTLTLTGNPGAPELTAEEQAVATGKGWTLKR